MWLGLLHVWREGLTIHSLLFSLQARLRRLEVDKQNAIDDKLGGELCGPLPLLFCVVQCPSTSCGVIALPLPVWSIAPPLPV